MSKKQPSENPGERPEAAIHYVNAKVVLVGETGVGKTGLGVRLAEGVWRPTPGSTHGMNVWPLHSEDGREVMLWDFAGQDEYKLVHQLFLNETSVALMLYDPTKSNDTFEGVEYWEKALRNVVQGDVRKILVAARVDVGGVRMTAADIEAYCKAHGYAAHFATSAETGEGCEELRAAIMAAIPWDKLPRTSSPAIFKRIKDFLAAVRQGRRVLVREDDLLDEFNAQAGTSAPTEAEFRTVIGHVETAGLIKRLSFGDFVLLKPELLNGYASDIVDAARRHPDGLGAVRKSDVLEGHIRLKEEGGLKSSDRVFLLHATVELFLRLGLALEQDGNLVFPSKFNRRMPPLEEDPVVEVEFSFEGPVENLYTTLVVKLYYGGVFRLRKLWKNAAEFLNARGLVCGFQLFNRGDGGGVLKVFYAEGVSDDDKALFLKVVSDHFAEKRVEVRRERLYRCPNPDCREPVRDRHAVRRALGRGALEMPCQYCFRPFPLMDALEVLYRDDEKFLSRVAEMKSRAEASMERGGELVAASAELRTENFKSWAGGVDIATVAIVFTDVIGSVALGEELKDEGMREVRRAHFAQTRRLVAQYKGYEIKTIGDSSIAAFRSVDKALDYVRTLQANTGHPLVQVRAGIHIGPVQVEENDVFGGVVNFAARITGYGGKLGTWLSDRAKADLDTMGEPRHVRLNWERLDDVEIKGFGGSFTLWGLAEAADAREAVPGGRSESEVEKLDKAAAEAASGLPALVVRRVSLRNIRGFRTLDIEMSSDRTMDWFVLLLGDNAAGKTTLLRAIALAFCDEASAAGLISPPDFLRSGAEEGLIRVEFGAQPNAARVDENPLWVEIRLTRVPSGEVKLEQATSPAFSRRRLFVAGYGPSRLSFGREQDAEYSSRDAVLTLFSRGTALMHPELVLRRLTSTGARWEDIARRLDAILHLPLGSVRLEPGGGMSIVGPHALGEAYSFTSVGDGYLSSLNWILDLCGAWMAFADAAPVDSISGVVLIDELEQHLHPSWQREVVSALRRQFPYVQFIATTHSALCALGTTAIPDESQVILLRGNEDAVEPVPYSAPNSQSVNQVLTSPLFGLFSASSFGTAANISRYAKLKSMPGRTPEQEAELAALREVLEGVLGPFEDEFHRHLERLIRQVATRELAGAIQEQGLDSETLGFEIRARLRDLLDLGGESDKD